ncbi:DNA topoisomerase III [Saccharobesus litoralis]|uniref:DNA topoisomerase 3 n=1 Tax=Saccharobesus litoralis TaxID=2172099 RepID=A0A2S0VRL1_9ALTE|nr:DNA topoisomerase III [Saccharobesus litoralis]AWB66857.1 DNA topoisomerase III [Saccharobesus litoralis]
MKLYIAEKPSLGRAIAAVLPKPHTKNDGYIQAANGDVVTWCIGHILEQAEPEAYNSEFKQWRFEHLPIVPQQWQLNPKAKTKKQLGVIRKLVKQATILVHAGDPDREGQLLVDEVIDYLNVPEVKKRNTKRLLISDLNASAVKRALQQLKDNRDFAALSVSALARSRADWLYGINLTRAYTLQGQKSGFNGVLSVGRVQTPILGLVVQRDQDIASFVPHDYYEVLADIQTPAGECFKVKWRPSEACRPYMDDQQRVIVKALAENVIRRIQNQAATVTQLKQQQKKQNAPLPYNLSALQIDASKQFNMNAKSVLDTCQSLYEKHKLVTYPRSDCRYLPKEHLNQAPNIIGQLSQSSEKYADWAKQADSSLVSKAWNDSKVGAHHAIVPTEKSAANITLSAYEQNVYFLIVRQYLAQFYPAYLYLQTQVELEIAGGKFAVTANTPQQLGWKTLFGKKQQAKKHQVEHTAQVSRNTSSNKQGYSDNHMEDSQGLEQQTLPPLVEGQVLHCLQGNLLSKQTQPPKPYTDATLLSAMTGIAKFVKNPDIRKILKETDGLGTEATRAGIIDLLFKRQFLQKQGKSILATELGKALVNALPDTATTPDMTAHWESTLNAISERQTQYQDFMLPLQASLQQLVQQAQHQVMTNLPKQQQAKGKKRFYKRKKKAA